MPRPVEMPNIGCDFAKTGRSKCPDCQPWFPLTEEEAKPVYIPKGALRFYMEEYRSVSNGKTGHAKRTPSVLVRVHFCAEHGRERLKPMRDAILGLLPIIDNSEWKLKAVANA